MKNFFKRAIVIALLSLLAGGLIYFKSDRTETRYYHELTIPPSDGILQAPAAITDHIQSNESFHYDLPSGWTEKMGTGMRLATFSSERNGQKIETSLVRLEGPAGSLESNVIRWMTQFNITPPSTSELSAHLSKLERTKTADGHDIVFIDLSVFMKDFTPEQELMMAAIVTTPSASIFFKMTGPYGALIAERSNLKNIAQSFRASP